VLRGRFGLTFFGEESGVLLIECLDSADFAKPTSISKRLFPCDDVFFETEKPEGTEKVDSVNTRLSAKFSLKGW